MSGFTVGLDIGQTNDPTALAVIEEVSSDPSSYHLRHTKRFELGTRYPKIVREVARLLRQDALTVSRRKTSRWRHHEVETSHSETSPTLVVDATGVGRPIVDMLEEEDLSPVPIWITGGESVTSEGREYRVPKRDLASTVQVLLQDGRLKFASDLPLKDVLVDELQKFRAKINISTGEASFEHWREQDTDDIVLALACALWYAESRGPRGRRDYKVVKF